MEFVIMTFAALLAFAWSLTYSRVYWNYIFKVRPNILESLIISAAATLLIVPPLYFVGKCLYLLDDIYHASKQMHANIFFWAMMLWILPLLPILVVDRRKADERQKSRHDSPTSPNSDASSAHLK